MLASFPIEQAQPNQEFYGLEVLPLLQIYTRDSYRDAGNGDPEFDPARPEQAWWDDTYDGHPPNELVTFSALVWASDGTATIGSFTQKAAWMRTPNFKGRPAYPRWHPAATQATRGGNAINPVTMSTELQARDLMAEIGGVDIVELGLQSLVIQGITVLQPVNYPADELRRLWSVVMPSGSNINVGYKLARKYSAGVGHPGHWVADASVEGGINWQPDALIDGSDSTAKPLPPPCRPLKINEEMQTYIVGLWAKGTRIRRSDLSAANGETGDIADIRTKVTALYNLLVPHN